MSVKSSISLTEQQDAFVRDQVKQGRYASASAVIQQGLDLLQRQTKAHETEIEALRLLVEQRRTEPFVSADEMQKRLKAMIDRKRRLHDVAD